MCHSDGACHVVVLIAVSVVGMDMLRSRYFAYIHAVVTYYMYVCRDAYTRYYMCYRL